MRILFIVLLAIFLVGCGKATIDASSDEAAKKSVKAVQESLKGEDRQEFDRFMAEVSAASALASLFSQDVVSFSSIIQPLNGMTGEQALAFFRAREAEKAERERKEAEEHAEKELVEFNELLARAEKAKSALAKIYISNIEIIDEGVGLTRNTKLVATISNGLEVPIRSISYTYELKSPDRQVAWHSGEGYFFIDGGLEPEESRELYSTGGLYGLASLKKKQQEHPDASIVLSITDASGPDKESLIGNLRDWELHRLEELREKLSQHQ